MTPPARFRAALLPGAAALCAAGAAPAQEAILLDEITVTAQAVPTPVTRTGATVTVVTEAELRASGETRLVDFLARLPGIGVITRGPIGTLAGLTIRGASQNYVKVLIDGIDVTDPSTPQVSFNFGGLTTADVSRVEILRGAQSALFGSEAVAGVISITTRRAAEPGLTQSADVEAGSFNSLRATYGLAWSDGRSEAAFTLSHLRTDGFSAADENAGNVEADGYEATRLSFFTATELDGGARIGLNGFWEDAAGDYDEQFPVADGSPDERFETETWALRGFAEFAAGPVDHKLSLSRFHIDRRDFGTTAFGRANTVYTGARTELAWQGDLALSETATLSFGADWTEETYTQRGDFGTGEGTSSVAGLWAEYAALVGAVDLAATLRFDEHSRFGGHLTGRLGAAWAVAPDWTLRGQVANGFRAPSNFELFGPFGDPTLEPEESLTVDLGLERRLGQDGRLAATLFYSEVTNLIDFPFPYAQVPGTVVRQGLELEADVALTDRVRLGAAYTYTDASNPPLSAGSAWFTTFGRHDLSAQLSADLTDRLAGVLSVQHVADRQGLPDYTVANATLTWALTDRADAYLRVENLFDEEYQLREGFGTSDRAIYVGLRTSF